jgi:hypothetical protein
MSRRVKIIILGALFLVLGYSVYNYVYLNYYPSNDAERAPAPNGDFVPLNVDNPALRMDILQHFLNLQYKGAHRNIFTATLPPPPQPVQHVPVNVATPVPAGPPPLTVDAKYFGYVSDLRGSHRRAFFAANNNEDVFIAGEGDTLMGRFRVVKITNTTADVEEVSSGRRATLILEQPGPNG